MLFTEGKDTVYASILQDDNHLVLVDCGFPNSYDALLYAMEKHKLQPANITDILLTHHDYDHVGNLARLVQDCPDAVVHASVPQAPFICGEMLSPRVEEAEGEFLEMLRGIVPLQVNKLLQDGDILSWCGGTQILYTDAHMPGHISLYCPALKTLVAGDALTLVDGSLHGPSCAYSINLEQWAPSLEKMESYDIRWVICYHGGVLQGDISGMISEILRGAY